MSLYLEIKHDLFTFCGRSRVDQEDPAGALHPLRLTNDLEPNGRRNPQFAPQPTEPARSDAASSLSDITANIFVIMCVVLMFFSLSIGFLKRANKRLWLHSLTILSSQSFVYKVCKRNCFPPPRVFKLIFHWGKIFWTQTLQISLFSPRKKKNPSQTPCLHKIAKKKEKPHKVSNVVSIIQ